MKYCKKCNFLTKDNIDICTECNSTLSDFDAKPDIPVIAVTAQGFEKERICAMLTEEDIPFSVRLVTKKRVKIQQNAVDGVSKAMHDIIVPYEYYYKAMELLVGINAVQLSDDELESLTEALENEENNTEAPDVGDYFSVKNRVVRIVSAFAFFALVAAVVFGVDAIAAFIKAWLT
ncbi:MAG: hypothetical protein UD936_07990 [Acutalibacteraceae bacterium]|nr:hypothetical protein [Acutalibacteraceae bacterium]